MINNILLFIFLFLLPVQLGKHFFFDFSYLSAIRVDYLAPTLYLTDALAFLLFILNRKYIFKIFQNKKFYLFLFLVLVNLFFAKNKFVALYFDLKIIEFLFIFIVFKNSRLDGKITLLVLILQGLLQLSLSLTQLAAKHSLQGLAYFLGERYLSLSSPAVAKASIGGVEFLRPYGSFSHPNSLAGFYLLIHFFVLTNKKFIRFSFLRNVFLFISSCLILISFSKLTIITYLILNAGYFIQKYSCRLCLMAKIILLLAVSFIFLQVKSDPQTIQKRIYLTTNAFVIISRHLLFGVGSGNYLIAQNKLPQKYLDVVNQPVHNIFMLFMAEWGAFGVLLTALVWNSLKIFFKKNWLVFVVVIFTGLFDHYWLTLQQNFLLVAAILGGL